MNRKTQLKASGRNDALFAGACIAALVIIGVAGQARAQEATGPKVSWNAAVTSDYVFRGVSQTQENPAISAGVDLTNGAFYAGAWASNVDFGDDSDAEVDLYGGWRPEVAGWALDLGGVAYLYTGQPDGADYDYVELKAAASRAVGPATVGAAVYYSPDFFGASEDEATYLEANAAFTPVDGVGRGGASMGVVGSRLRHLEPRRGLRPDRPPDRRCPLPRHRPARLRRQLWRARRGLAEGDLLRITS